MKTLNSFSMDVGRVAAAEGSVVGPGILVGICKACDSELSKSALQRVVLACVVPLV